MAINVEIKKIADDGRLVKYSYLSSTGDERTLTVDRETEQVWPDDGLENFEYNGAVRALVGSWRVKGDFPDRARYQS